MTRQTLPLLVLICLSLFACGPLTPSRSVAVSLAQELKSNSVVTVDISKHTDFEWDTLFVFGPYSFPSEICAKLEFDKPKCQAAQFADVGEGEHLLVFFRAKTIVRRETLPRLTADFDPSSLSKPIPRGRAIFLVNRSTGRNILACSQC
jgi:hypothetical protein